MPKKVDDCVKQLKKKGYDDDSAWAICTEMYKKWKEKKKKKSK